MPEPQDASPVSKRSQRLQLDEWVALIVAFGAIGAILAYNLLRDQPGGTFSLLIKRDPSSLSASITATGTESESESSDQANRLINKTQETTQRLVSQTNISIKGFGALMSSGLWISGQGRSPVDLPQRSDAIEPVNPAPNSEAETVEATPATTASEAEQPEVAAGSASVATDLEVTAAPMTFSDVAADRWSKPFIDELSKRKLISGFPDGTFAPDRPVTRAELAAQIQQIFERDDRLRELIAFRDVSADYWGRAAIDKSVEIGFLNGYPNAIFAPDKSVSRLEVAIALATGLGLNPSVTPEAILAIFPDAEAIPGWAKPKIAAATQAGFAVVDPELKQLDPHAAATREVVAVMMYQALVWAGEAEPLTSDRLLRP
ncbi:MAG: S-layer homology domain-containing protein [Oscillatoriales cyanobacterium]|nr:MAG: S-layer homology domain-containing protein [Oscillatoriales cyanobacterium]